MVVHLPFDVSEMVPIVFQFVPSVEYSA